MDIAVEDEVRTLTFKREEEVSFTNDDIDDIMEIALEGGITYWCNKVKPQGRYLGNYASEQISRGGTLLLYDAEVDGAYILLTPDNFISGLQLFLQNTPYLGRYVHSGKLDTSEIDGEDADAIIQFALFGEIMYG